MRRFDNELRFFVYALLLEGKVLHADQSRRFNFSGSETQFVPSSVVAALLVEFSATEAFFRFLVSLVPSLVSLLPASSPVAFRGSVSSRI